MEKTRDVSGSGPVSVDGKIVGHCAYEINVYKDVTGRVIGKGHALGDPAILAKMHYGQRIQLSQNEDKSFFVVTGDWSPGERSISVEAGPDIDA
ncbi:MAG: hypothetical protein JWM58_863 [Rhizobium sp.]|nr:hypothetical protein [Rhizobium sp.]